jgi:hypothetical protein
VSGRRLVASIYVPWMAPAWLNTYPCMALLMQPCIYVYMLAQLLLFPSIAVQASLGLIDGGRKTCRRSRVEPCAPCARKSCILRRTPSRTCTPVSTCTSMPTPS